MNSFEVIRIGNDVMLSLNAKKEIALLLAISKNPSSFVFPPLCTDEDIEEITFIASRMKNNVKYGRDPKDSGTDDCNSIDDRIHNLNGEKEDPNEW